MLILYDPVSSLWSCQHVSGLENFLYITGIENVKNTEFDLTEETDLGDRIPKVPGDFGFDHNFCLGKPGWRKHAAK